MAGLVRDRSCLYYIPWIALLGVALLGAGTGVWIYHVNEVYDSTRKGLDILSVDASNLDRPRPAMIATAVIYLVFVTMLFLLSLARSFIEAAHDATGLAGAGSVVWMVFNVLTACGWWLIVLWLVVAIMGCAVWSGLLYVFRGAIDILTEKYGPQPSVTWLPSSNQTCPGECLNLTYFKFIDAQLEDSCICDYTQLASARTEFDYAFRLSAAVLVGVSVMYLAGFILAVNFACQFSHTKREREYIRRLTFKQFIGI